MIDTHSHLYDEAFDMDRLDCMACDKQAGVEAVVLPAINSSSHEALFDLSRKYPDYCFPLIGLHPTSVNEIDDFRSELQIIERILVSPPVARIYGIGEIGLDLHWSKDRLPQQIEAFEFQIELALRYDLPIVIHTREAWGQMHEVLDRYSGRGLRGVMHAFSGTIDDYLRVKSYGHFLFGIGGVVTYKRSLLSEVLPSIALDDMVLESDAPYLSPVPLRGRRNESSFMSHTAAKIAYLKDVDIEEVNRQTNQNAKKMFGI